MIFLVFNVFKISNLKSRCLKAGVSGCPKSGLVRISEICCTWSILTLVPLEEFAQSLTDECLVIFDNWQSWEKRFNPNIDIVSKITKKRIFKYIFWVFNGTFVWTAKHYLLCHLWKMNTMSDEQGTALNCPVMKCSCKWPGHSITWQADNLGNKLLSFF